MNDENEVLKCLERIGSDYFLGSKDCLVKKIYEKEYNTIKNYILKEQEPKQYLKWEDLEFDAPTSIKVKMGYTQYFLSLSRHLGVNQVVLRNDDAIAYLLLYEKDKQFFNDLCLERME